MTDSYHAQEAASVVIGDIASKTTNIGAATAVGAQFIANNWVGVVGLGVAVAGFLVKWYYEQKTFKLLQARKTGLPE